MSAIKMNRITKEEKLATQEGILQLDERRNKDEEIIKVKAYEIIKHTHSHTATSTLIFLIACDKHV